MEAGAAKHGASTSAKEEISREEERRPSLNSLALMRKATTPDDISSVDIKDWRDVVYEGVFLKHNKQRTGQKFWVHEKLHKNCFLVLPKACDIAGGDEESCWSWITEKERWFSFGSDVDICVPESKQLSWLLIQGRFKTRALSPNTTYEVAFVVKLLGPDSSWSFTVESQLNGPGETHKTEYHRLEKEPKGEWIELRAGEFMMGPKTVGRMTFALHEKFDGQKSGLILRGVLIHPKDDSAKHNQDDAGSTSSSS